MIRDMKEQTVPGGSALLVTLPNVECVRHIRAMRGGTQSHLLEADDGHFYVVKFKNNPQHRRVLVNEVLASELLKYLDILTPKTALIRISQTFLDSNPALLLSIGTKKVPIVRGLHFGSRFPGHPSKTAVYDFMPDRLFHMVINCSDFCGVLAFDKWTSNSDGRQAIFVRTPLEPMVKNVDHGGCSSRRGYIALMIDQGFAFNGPEWNFPESPALGLYSRRLVYENVKAAGDFDPWLSRIGSLPEEVLESACNAIPPDWLDGDQGELERMVEQLLARRTQIPDLLSDARGANNNPFPNWP